jgi:protein-tyrosine phosphatase
MRAIVDLHNHLLPGIDDGAPDLATALQLAQVAVEDGITHMVCTPHIHPGRYDNTQVTIASALAQFKQALNQQAINLQVSAAAEVRFGMELMAWVKSGEIPFIGEYKGKSVLLLEFPHGEVPFGAEKLIKWLIAKEITPMIAHPERNKGIMAQPSKLKPFLQLGCLTQVTAQSMTGGFGSACQEIAHKLLVEDQITIIASDAHNTQHRPPKVAEAFSVIETLSSKQHADLIADNAKEISSIHFSHAA